MASSTGSTSMPDKEHGLYILDSDDEFAESFVSENASVRADLSDDDSDSSFGEFQEPVRIKSTVVDTSKVAEVHATTSGDNLQSGELQNISDTKENCENKTGGGVAAPFDDESKERSPSMSGEDLSDGGEGGDDCEIFEDHGLLTEIVEQLFIAIDDDKDDFLSDSDVDLMKSRLKVFEKQRYLPLIRWMAEIPSGSIRNMSKEKFVDATEKALLEHCANMEDGINLANSLIGTLAEARENNNKRAPQLSLTPKSAKKRKGKRKPKTRQSDNGELVFSPRSGTWKGAKYDISEQTRIGKKPWMERYKKPKAVSSLDRPHSPGPREIGRIHGWKPARFKRAKRAKTKERC